MGSWWGKQDPQRQEKRGKTGRRVGGLKPQPAFNFSQTTRSWCPMPYIFKGMYTSPLPASDTDGDRNIQALGNRFLWCCFPCGALCWQTELAINSLSAGWTSSLALRKPHHRAAHRYLPLALKVWSSSLGRVALNNSTQCFSLQPHVELQLFVCCSGDLPSLWKSRGYSRTFHVSDPHHGSASPPPPLFPQARQGRMIHWHWISLALAAFLGRSLDPTLKLLLLSGEKE